MDVLDIWSVMKWVLLVLLAGFVGQFGKTFAQQMMKRFRKEPKVPVGAEEDPGGKLPAAPHAGVPPRPDLPSAVPSAPPAPPAEPAPPPADKKLIKALAKQKKKEGKALQKADKG